MTGGVGVAAESDDRRKEGREGGREGGSEGGSKANACSDLLGNESTTPATRRRRAIFPR